MTSAQRDRHANELLTAVSPFLDSLPAGPGLDIGSGSGVGMRFIQLLGRSAEGIDRDVKLIKEATAAGFDVSYTEDPASWLREREGSYAVVVLRDVIEHFPLDAAERVLSAAHQSLRPGGAVVLVTPNALSPLNGLMRYIDATHHFSSTTFSMTPLMMAAGFEDVHFVPTDWSYRRTGGKALWRLESRQAAARWLVRRVWSGVVWAEYGVSPRRGGLPIDLNLTFVGRRLSAPHLQS